MIKKLIIEKKKLIKKPILKKSLINYESHPEQKDDELFIGNASERSFKNILWKTKRKGKIPYSVVTGKPLVDSNLFPIFITKQEKQDYIEGKFNLSDNLPNKNKVKLKLKRGIFKLGKDALVFID